MATSKLILEPWLASKKKWENIFSLHVPKPADLLALMDDWSHFRQMTIGLAERTAKIPGSDKFFLDACSFIDTACRFFDVSEPKNLPLSSNLQIKLREAATKVTPVSQSLLTLEVFKDQFPKAIDAAQALKRQREKEERDAEQEQKVQQVSRRIQESPFFTSATTIQDRLQSEIERIKLKNPDDGRLIHLNKVKELIQGQIDAAKEECKQDYLSKNPGSQQEVIKSQCRDEMAKIVKTNLIDNNALDINFRTWLGRAILNAVIALPVKIYSSCKHIPENQLFFKLKTESQTIAVQIHKDITKLEPAR